MPVPLSEAAKHRVEKLFPLADWSSSHALLTNECWNNLPFLDSFDAVRLERFRFAALKLSDCNIKAPKKYRLRRKSRRDVSMTITGFAVDANAHKPRLE